ncbi:MAG: xanthine dehydrogenase family protein molybdopterin-binding subunit [Rhodospirillaceae bacterium]|nr:xanthine dehydrogenase family protein molybdopterin-binding subunit [Rhodospirillaceae bacterium]
MTEPVFSWIGKALPRKEDPALLTGQARFIDDLEPVAGLRHVAIVRSPHAHGRIRSIDVDSALAMHGVDAVVTGSDIAAILKPIPSVVRTPIRYMPVGVDKVRFAGEPVAVVVASDRYLAEDAAEQVSVEIDPLDPVVGPVAAMCDTAPLLHEDADSNCVSFRTFRYGDPDTAFARAARTVSLDYTFHRYASTPIETYGVIAHAEKAPDRYTVWSNFQGPFVLHPLMAGALGVAGNRLRLITAPASGGSFGIKQAIFGYILLLSAVSRLTGHPVKWVEDRLEHLTASSAAAERVGRIDGAFDENGTLTGLRFDNIANMGAYLRPPEPASVYRMHAASNGCYRVPHIAVENRLVVTNTLPVGLNRGYGGPQFFFALERLIDCAARKLGFDPVELRRQNFLRKEAFPYTTPGGATFDSSDYDKAMDMLLAAADYKGLKERRADVRRAGNYFGIGFACGIEPSGSNMAYVSLAQTPEERAKAGPKSGGNASATIEMDPSGSVTVQLCSTPNGQGHATVAAQIVAQALAINPADIDVVTDIDTRNDAWSISSGNYSNRFAAAVTGAIVTCADRVSMRLRKIAAELFECAVDDVELADGKVRIKGIPNRALPVKRVAAAAHWHPDGLPDGLDAGLTETAIIHSETLTAPDDHDRVSSAVTYGIVFDLAAVSIAPDTGKMTVEKYVSVHDVGNQLNPLVVEGQILGGFAHGVGGAMYEELSYDTDGNPLNGTFADYRCPTAMEVPPVTVRHLTTPSEKSLLGSKGLGDGSSMTTPAALANAVADALGREDITLPLTPPTLWRMIHEDIA